MTRPLITDAEIIAGWTGPLAARDIAKRSNVRWENIHRRAKNLGLEVNSRSVSDTDKAKLRKLWFEPLTVQQIADELCISHAAVSKRARMLELPHRGYRHRAKAVPPEPKPAVPEPTDLTGRLVASKGYAALAEIAKAQGWTQRQALQRWHEARP